MEWWFVEFKVSDSGTGLNRINVNQNSQDVRVPYTNEQILYYRYHFIVNLLGGLFLDVFPALEVSGLA